MNHLAHIFLSYPDEYCLTGNFLTDFLTVSELRMLDSRLEKGVILHRRIDEFTDAHPSVRKSADLLRPVHKKYTPVVTDIYFDYFLIRNWTLFHSKSLDIFIGKVYTVLANNKYLMPDRMHQRMDRMIDSDFLRSCATPHRLEKTFTFLQQRTRFDNQLHRAHEDLLKHEQELNALFLSFFPDLMAEVDKNSI